MDGVLPLFVGDGVEMNDFPERSIREIHAPRTRLDFADEMTLWTSQTEPSV